MGSGDGDGQDVHPAAESGDVLPSLPQLEAVRGQGTLALEEVCNAQLIRTLGPNHLTQDLHHLN
jgi:hypothetical protein